MALTFVNPPPFGAVGDYKNLLNFGLQQMVTLEWQNLDAEASLWLLKDDDKYTCMELNRAQTFCASVLCDTTSYDWIVQTYGYNYTSSSPQPIFYLSLNTSSAEGAASHYFNILPEDQVPSTTTTSSAAPTASTGPSAPATSVTGPLPSAATSTTSAAASSNVAPSTALTPQIKTAIGVAVGLGVPLIIVLAVIAFFLRRKKRRVSSRRSQTPDIAMVASSRYSDKPLASDRSNDNQMARNGSTSNVAQELPGTTDQQSPWR
ncbi:hypothetical protein LTS15_000930 [Exophiala xenobiotica]|nr:hypothetical protein LTS15_000930 [Exophiala xenobiotica]